MIDPVRPGQPLRGGFRGASVANQEGSQPMPRAFERHLFARAREFTRNLNTASSEAVNVR